ncbi:hypothetical protein DSM112329_04349 [Paraconexibacter sp. AEG42_29]|uniref:MobA-like NTP transferase domain-containing protein n=1 Tax=Paraconexibacter sp. AEG42_29 TaxID=2997339 RepID=A0AAU7B0D7_9ACTN
MTAAGGGPLAVVVLDALAGADPGDSLAALLGPVAASALRRELLRGARRWAAATATPGGPGAFEANTTDAALTALHGHCGPVVFVAPDVPGLDHALGAAVLGDLADGVGLTFAPTFDATPYLMATPTLDAEFLALAGGHRDELFRTVGGRGAPVGMLRSERRLATAADARAVAADPSTPLELGVLLAAGLDVRIRRA